MNIHTGAGDALRRREEIAKIVRERTVHSPDELLAVLRKRGFRVTQPTLSRDIRELGLAKTAGGYVAAAAIAAAAPSADFVPRDVREGRFEQLVRDNVLSADVAGNMVVIKTPPASA